jgi:hypothetical protein
MQSYFNIKNIIDQLEAIMVDILKDILSLQLLHYLPKEFQLDRKLITNNEMLPPF